MSSDSYWSSEDEKIYNYIYQYFLSWEQKDFQMLTANDLLHCAETVAY